MYPTSKPSTLTGYPLYGASSSTVSSSSYGISSLMGNRDSRAARGGTASNGYYHGAAAAGGELATAAQSFVPADDSNVIVDQFKTGLSPVRSSTTGGAGGSYAQRYLGTRSGTAAGTVSRTTMADSYAGVPQQQQQTSYYGYERGSSTSTGQPTQQRASSSSATTRRPLPAGASASSSVANSYAGLDQQRDYRYGVSSSSSSSSALRRPSSGQFAAASSYDQQQASAAAVSSTRASRVPLSGTDRTGVGLGVPSLSNRVSSASAVGHSSSSSSAAMLPPTSARTRLLPQQSEMTVPDDYRGGLKGGNPSSAPVAAAVPGTVSRRATGTGALAFEAPTTAPTKRVSSSTSLGIGPGSLDGLPASLTSKQANAAAGIFPERAERTAATATSGAISERSLAAMRELAAQTHQLNLATANATNAYSTSTRGNSVTTHYYGQQQAPSSFAAENRPIQSSGSYKLPDASTGVYRTSASAAMPSSSSGGIGGRRQYVDNSDSGDDNDNDDGDDDDDVDIYRAASSNSSSSANNNKFMVSSRAYQSATTSSATSATSSSSSSSSRAAAPSSSSSAAAAAVAQQKAALLARSNQLNRQQPQQQSKYDDGSDDDGYSQGEDEDSEEEDDRRDYKPSYYTSSGSAGRGAGALPSSSASSTAIAARKAPQPNPYASAPRGLVGLMNLGNTCFMNSCLQCVSNIPPLTDLFLAGSSLHINRNPATSRTRGEVAMAWAELMSRFWGRSSSGSSVESPSRIKKIVGTVASRFLGYDQQDSQEFLVFLLDSLMDDTNTIPGKPPYKELSEKPEQSDAEVANGWWRYYGERCDSRVRDLLTGQLKTLVRCESCGHISRAFDPFTTLALPIPKSAQVGGDECSLNDCFRAFTTPEVLSGSEAHYCSRCKTHRTCTKTMTLFRLPPVLILQLKRFTFSTFRRTKLTTSVKFPVQDLDMRPFVASSPLASSAAAGAYDLVAISNHSGSLGGGHYTADARCRDDGQWYHFNDSHVSSTTPRHLSGSAAYLLFYVRRDLL
jgi:ubiquitin C-terminal hydrolase